MATLKTRRQIDAAARAIAARVGALVTPQIAAALRRVRLADPASFRQPRDPTAAARQRRCRARKRSAATGDLAIGHLSFGA